MKVFNLDYMFYENVGKPDKNVEGILFIYTINYILPKIKVHKTV